MTKLESYQAAIDKAWEALVDLEGAENECMLSHGEGLECCIKHSFVRRVAEEALSLPKPDLDAVVAEAKADRDRLWKEAMKRWGAGGILRLNVSAEVEKRAAALREGKVKEK